MQKGGASPPNTNHFGDAGGFASVSGVWSQSAGPSGPLRRHNCSFNISEKRELVKIQDRSDALLKSDASLTLAGPLLASLVQLLVGFFSVFRFLVFFFSSLYYMSLFLKKRKVH